MDSATTVCSESMWRWIRHSISALASERESIEAPRPATPLERFLHERQRIAGSTCSEPSASAFNLLDLFARNGCRFRAPVLSNDQRLVRVKGASPRITECLGDSGDDVSGGSARQRKPKTRFDPEREITWNQIGRLRPRLTAGRRSEFRKSGGVFAE